MTSWFRTQLYSSLSGSTQGQSSYNEKENALKGEQNDCEKTEENLNPEPLKISIFSYLGREDVQFQQPVSQTCPDALNIQKLSGETFQDGCNDSSGKVL